jgi:hypothetical protein
MQYLGGLQGKGRLIRGGETFARAEYDFEGFITKAGHMTGSGEIRAAPAEMREMFALGTVKLLTDDGRLMSLRFTQKKLSSNDSAAHVDMIGELPPIAAWHH